MNEVVDTAKMFTLRFLLSDFQKQTITQDEAEALDQVSPPIEAPVVRNYLAWRRALLWIAGVSLGFATIFSLISFVEQSQKQQPGSVPPLIWAILLIPTAGMAGGSYLAIQASRSWTNVSTTRMLARLSWACVFLVPFAVALIPLAAFLDPQQYGGPQFVQVLAAAFGVNYFVALLPSVFGLFPGLIRSSLTLKTLLPESTMPGWLAVVIAPIYALFFLLVLVIVVQLQSLIGIIGFALLFLAPLNLTLHARELTSPVAPEHLPDTLGKVRRRFGMMNIIGLIAVLWVAKNAVQQIPLTGMLSFLANVISSILLVTIACSDLLISLFKAAFERENALRQGALLDDLTNRFAAFDELGLTNLDAGELDALRRFRRGKDNDPEAPGPPPPPPSPPPPPQ